MGFVDLKFEHFSCYPNSTGENSSDYFLFGYDGVRLPNLALDLHLEGYEGVSAREFYDEIFGDYLEVEQRNPKDYIEGEYGGILIEKVPQFYKNGKKIMLDLYNKKTDSFYKEQKLFFNRQTFTRGQQKLYDMIQESDNFVITSPISYAGRNRTNKNARQLFALVIEIDQIVPDTGLKELIYSWSRSNYFRGQKTYDQLPRPTFIVCSGKGLHLYFLFDEPLPLYPKIHEQLSKAKNYLTYRFWNRYITRLHGEKQVQYEPINQPFRVVGTTAKEKGVYALAFRTGGRYTLDDFNYFLPKDKKIDYQKKSDLSREKAKELYPEWYERRVVRKRKLVLGTSTFYRHRGIYDSWKKKILEGATVGKRYFCLENLCSLAVQCQISEEELDRDIADIAEYFEQLTISEDNHFTRNDIISAKTTFKYPSVNTFRRRIDYISQRTGIPLERAKRNGRTRKQHLRRARSILAIDREELVKEGKFKDVGRPSKKEIVQEWRKNNPNKRKIDCQRETGLSRPTILKYWDN